MLDTKTVSKYFLCIKCIVGALGSYDDLVLPRELSLPGLRVESSRCRPRVEYYRCGLRAKFSWPILGSI